MGRLEGERQEEEESKFQKKGEERREGSSPKCGLGPEASPPPSPHFPLPPEAHGGRAQLAATDALGQEPLGLQSLGKSGWREEGGGEGPVLTFRWRGQRRD